MSSLGRPSDGAARSAVIAELWAAADPARLAGMARVGIRIDAALGVSIPRIRRLARRIGTDHRLAQALWSTRIHEARILASMIDDPQRLSAAQMNRWAASFDSWDLCDQVCSNLFDRTPLAYDRAFAWSSARREFVKRAAFALMASLALHDARVSDAELAAFLPVIERESPDGRNAVKKSASWALRQIGKRDAALHRRAVSTAKHLRASDTAAARWIGADALRELSSDAVVERLRASRPGRR
jgi:3-methyladenine DNA glycosylase AlkD